MASCRHGHIERAPAAVRTSSRNHALQCERRLAPSLHWAAIRRAWSKYCSARRNLHSRMMGENGTDLAIGVAEIWTPLLARNCSHLSVSQLPVNGLLNRPITQRLHSSLRILNSRHRTTKYQKRQSQVQGKTPQSFCSAHRNAWPRKQSTPRQNAVPVKADGKFPA